MKLSQAEASSAIRRGDVVPLFQPIEALQTGECRGFEALARLSYQDQLLPPSAFLDVLEEDDRLCLFGAMLGHGIACLKRHDGVTRSLFVSVNVEVSLLLIKNFADVLRFLLDLHNFEGERIVLEILEREEVVRSSDLHRVLDKIHALGLSIALDDLGSGYASLAKLRDLPVELFKLDGSFTRDIEMHIEDLAFVQTTLSLAQGLGRRLIVEGIETPEAYDAMRVLGVELGQGFGIARPMPNPAIPDWLSTRQIRSATQTPRSLLGAYASHLNVVESCRALRRQPLPVQWAPEAKDHRSCVIGRLFSARNWHDTTFGEAHKAFHAALPTFKTDLVRWDTAVHDFQEAMAAAIAARAHEFGCLSVAEAVATRREAPAEDPETTPVIQRRSAS